MAELIRDDDVVQVSPAAASKVISDNDVVSYGDAIEKPSMLDSFQRGFTGGLTFEGDDEAIGIIKGEKARDERRAAKKFDFAENPWSTGLGKATGAIAGFLPFLAPLRGAGVGARAYQGARWLTGAENIARSVPGAALPVGGGVRGAIAGTHAGQGGIAAAKYGMLSRFGDEGSDDPNASTWDHLMERATNAVNPANVALDYGLGRAGTAAGNWVGDKIANVGNLTAMSRANSGGRRVGEALRNDSADLNTIVDAVMPTYGRMPQETIRGALRTYGEGLGQGLDEMGARRQVEQFLLQNGTANPRTAVTQARALVDRYNERNAVPAQLHELVAATTDSSGYNTRGLVRHAVNSKASGPATGELYGHALNRQRSQAGRVANIFAQRLGDGDVGRMIHELSTRTRAANSLYRPITDDARQVADMPDKLRAAIEAARDAMEQGEWHGRNDDLVATAKGWLDKFMPKETNTINMGHQPVMTAAKTVEKIDPNTGAAFAVRDPATQMPRGQQLPDGSIVPETRAVAQDITERRGVTSLESYIGQRSALEQAIQESMQMGRPTPMTVHLRQLKEALDDQVFGLAGAPDAAGAPPTVGGVMQRLQAANAQRADAGAMQRAYNEGLNLNIQAQKGKLVDLERTLQRIDGAPDETQEMFLNGIMAQIQGKLQTGGELHDVAKIFNNPRMMGLMGRLLGQDVAQELAGHIQRAALGTATVNLSRNSVTSGVQDHSRYQQVVNMISAAMDFMFNPAAAMRKGAEYVGDRMMREQTDQAMGILGAHTERPDLLLQAIQQARDGMAAAPATSPYAQQVRQVSPFAGFAGGQAVEEQISR